MKKYHPFLALMLTMLIPSLSHADPWFTSPLLINAAEVVPLGTANLQIYLQNSNTAGIYNRNFSFTPTSTINTNSLLTKLNYGLATDVDFELDVLYQENQTLKVSNTHIGDTLMLLGFQMLKQGTSSSRPNVRLILQEIFPTGRYNQLSPDFYGTQATGFGSYQTSLSLNVGLLSKFSETHYLKTTGAVTATYAATTHLNQESVYGGSISTHGNIAPGNALAFDFSAEYSLTQQWAAVLEGFFLAQQASEFKGVIGSNPVTPFRRIIALKNNFIRPTKHNIGGKNSIGNGNLALSTFAPAVEYSISKNAGFTGGVWFTTNGKNTPQFISSIFVINLTW